MQSHTIWTASLALSIDNIKTPTGKTLNVLELISEGDDFLQTPCTIAGGQMVVGSICYTDADAQRQQPQQTKKIKTLSDGQRARIAGANHRQHIQIGHTMTQLLADFDQDRAQAIFDKGLNNGHAIAFGIALSTCLTADYEGKAADLAADRAAHNAAPLIEQGELVIIEGEYFTAKISDRRVSNPLRFLRAPEPEQTGVTA